MTSHPKHRVIITVNTTSHGVCYPSSIYRCNLPAIVKSTLQTLTSLFMIVKKKRILTSSLSATSTLESLPPQVRPGSHYLTQGDSYIHQVTSFTNAVVLTSVRSKNSRRYGIYLPLERCWRFSVISVGLEFAPRPAAQIFSHRLIHQHNTC